MWNTFTRKAAPGTSQCADDTSQLPIFFTIDQVTELVSGGAEWLTDYCDIYQRRMNELTDFSNQGAHLWHFMPPPSYEDRYGLVLMKGDTYIPAFGASSQLYLLLELCPSQEAGVIIDLGLGAALELVRNGDQVTCTMKGNEITVQGTQIRVTANHNKTSWIVGVEGQTICHFKARNKVVEPKVELRNGSAAVVMAQSLAPLPSFVFFDCAQGERIQRLPAERNPYRFEWGLRSIRVNATIMMSAVLHDIALALATKPGLIADTQLAQRIDQLSQGYNDTLERLLRAYLTWPRWRPGLGDHPESGPWDRNSFTNGIIPLSAAMLSHLRPGIITRQHLQDALTARASAYFQAADRIDFLNSSKGRQANWWIKRSANHGMIMIFAYVAAMRLAGLERSDASAFVHMTGFTALEKLFDDGSFCEGIHYLGFALAPCLPYFHQLRGAGHRDLEQFEAQLEKTYDWWSLSHDSTGQVFANFGDNVDRNPSTDRVSIGRYLKNFAAADMADATNLSSTDPYAPFVMFGSFPNQRQTGLVTRVYRRNKFALAVLIDRAHRRQSGLFVIGSRLQRTHNRNHDGLGFAFYAPGLRIGIDQAGKQPITNNGVSFVDDQCKLLKIDSVREYSGSVRELGRATDEAASFVAELNDIDMSVDGFGQFRITMRRWFLYRPTAPCPLVIGTEIEPPAGLQPALSFNLDLREPDGPPTAACFELNGREGWQPLRPRSNSGAAVFAVEGVGRRVYRFVTGFGAAGVTAEEMSSDLPWPDWARK